jgi:hypothetical protein
MGPAGIRVKQNIDSVTRCHFAKNGHDIRHMNGTDGLVANGEYCPECWMSPIPYALTLYTPEPWMIPFPIPMRRPLSEFGVREFQESDGNLGKC